ncbi:Glycosyltransferase, GT2 family [Alteribacillus persepolensis]|uniref:Glycosyltransferase, GT2 family n=2 Tax=Alteribacillus persepolensis TaxID=568899 RepID=A0A1G8IR03_9BACI|nr:Glycosyltransferase, GT2 family [Alteribacillus persepolensis]
MKSYSSPTISIIFPAKNEGENVKNTLHSLFAARSNQHYEVIIVDDNSSDGCCDFLNHYPKRNRVLLIRTAGIGAANARNEGAKHAKGKYLIFCDAHLYFEHYWMDQLLDALKHEETDAVCPGIADADNPSSAGYGQTLKHNLSIKWGSKSTSLKDTAILPGGCFIIPKSIFNKVGGFERSFKTWGFEDIEFSIKMWLFGYRCSVLSSVKVLHIFRKSHPYQISKDHINYNMMRMAYAHFHTSRIKRCKKLIKKSDPMKIEKMVLKDGALNQRNAYFKQRVHDDNWYFQRFGIPF